MRLYLLSLITFVISVIQLTLWPLPAQAKSLSQETEAILRIENQSNQVICSVVITSSTAFGSGEEVVADNERIALGEIKSFELVPGLYELLLTGCEGNTLLNQPLINAAEDIKLVLTNETIRAEACRIKQQEGTNLYRQGDLSSSILITLETIDCFRAIGDLTNEAGALFVISNLYYLTGQYNDALENLQKALQIYEEVGYVFSQGEALFGIGILYYKQEEYNAALDSLQQALKIWQLIGDRVYEGNTLVALGTVYKTQYQYDKAAEDFRKALDIWREVNDRNREKDTLVGLGMVYYAFSRYDEALESFQESLAVVRELGDQELEWLILNNIGQIYEFKVEYDKALKHYEQALIIAKAVGNRSGEGTILGNIGLIYHAQRQYNRAIEGYKKALSIAQEVGDRSGEGTVLNNIGGVYKIQGQYIKAKMYFEQSLAIRQEVKDRAGEALTLFNMGGIYDDQGRYPEALENYQKALLIQREMHDRKAESTTLIGMGSVYYHQGRYNQALDIVEQALTIRRDIGDKLGESAALDSLGVVYSDQGQNAKALRHHEQALAIQQEVSEHADEGDTLNNIGKVYHELGRYSKALESLQQALDLAQKAEDLAGEGITLNNIGDVYDSQSRHDTALETYVQGLAIVREVGDRASEATILNNIGMVYLDQGRYGEALENFQQALAIMQQIGNLPGEGVTLNNIGLAYGNQGRYDDAFAHYQQALTIMQTIGNRIGEGTTLNNIGFVYVDRGEYDEALKNYQQALSIMQEVGNRRSEGAEYNSIGFVLTALGSYSDALEYHQQALMIHQSLGDHEGEGADFNNLGTLYATQGEYNEALDNLQQALVNMRKVSNKKGEGVTLSNIGFVYASQGRYREALEHYQQSLVVFDAIRTVAGSEMGRTQFIDQYAYVYDRSVTAALKLSKEKEAFLITELGRARAFLDALSTGQVQLEDNAAAELLLQEQALYAERQVLQDELIRSRALEPSDTAQISILETQLAEVEKTYSNVLTQIAARGDQLEELLAERSTVLDLTQTQALLDDDTTIVSYWMLDDRAFAFIITSSNFNVVELLDATPDAVHVVLNGLYRWVNREHPYPRLLRQLHNWLVAPLSHYLHTSHIAIIPHRQLHYVPFASLTDGTNYWGEQFTLSILPSATTLKYLQKNAQTAQKAGYKDVLIFGNPTTMQQPLAYATDEAQAISKLVDSTIYTATAATEEQLWRNAEHISVLHLATHGEYNEANALYSAIYLAPSQLAMPTDLVTSTNVSSIGDTTRDGRLETREIFRLPLSGTNLVTLSACETNVGKLSRGDDIVGLTRAFFFAGAPTVISSLWKVDDAATETLMVSFYHYWLQDGMSKAEALQAAQVDVRSDPRWVSPFYWAGFVLNGDPGQRNHASSVK